MTPRRLLGLTASLLVLASAPSAAAQDPADQPPFGGADVPPRTERTGELTPPPGFRLSASEALRMAVYSGAA